MAHGVNLHRTNDHLVGSLQELLSGYYTGIVDEDRNLRKNKKKIVFIILLFT